MIALLGMGIISSWFYMAAKSVNKSGPLWAFIGIFYYLAFGLFFLAISDKYIFGSRTLPEAFTLQPEKIVLQLIGIVLMILLGLPVQKIFLSKKKQQ